MQPLFRHTREIADYAGRMRQTPRQVVEPHSRSVVPFANSGMRVAEVTGCSLTSSLVSLRFAFTASTILLQKSMA